MKKLLLAFIPALLLSATVMVPSAKAQVAFPTMEVTMKLTLTPFNLAYLALQGYFENQGIPSNNALMQDFRNGKITGTQVVKAAVAEKRLPDSFLNNEAYIKGVSNQLNNLSLTY